jgi:[acyl-carrier-protein] S-malonyltransferase
MTSFAIVFPGQGSQAVGMLDAWGDHPAVQSTLKQASSVLGMDMAALIAHGPKHQLDLTTQTQPVMLTVGVACWRAWVEATGLRPTLLAGHSLGEYTALVVSGALSFEQALPLVQFRAQAMQQAVPAGSGGMAAVLGLDAPSVQAVCAHVSEQLGQVVEAVNFNDPQQTVIAGTKAAVEQACTLLKEKGAKRALLLPVSAPFHSSLMAPAAQALRERLLTVDVRAPDVSVINNIDVVVQSEPQAIRDALYRQAFGPVRWVQLVQAMRERGVTHVVECGPGKVLAGLCRRIDPQLTGLSVFDPATLQSTLEALS